MDLVFTDHIRSLEPPEDGSAGFDAAWKKLESELTRAIKRIGLWHLPPRYLGVEDAERWDHPRAFDDLAVDCYVYAILDRLPSLKALIEVSGTVEGAVVRNVRHFVFDRQRKQDPVGYRIYDVTRCALERLIEGETLAVTEGKPGKINNVTLLSFPSESGCVESLAGDLREHVEGWRGGLFTDMVLGIRKRRHEAEQELASAIADLQRGGVAAFRFKGLIDPIKERGRRHWGSLFAQEEGDYAPAGEAKDGEVPPLVPVVKPGSPLEEQEAYSKLLECMARKLARCQVRSRVRDELQRLWALLKIHAPQSDRPLPERRAAEMLGIARGTLRQRLKQLRSLVAGCRAALAGRREEAT